MNNDFFEEQSDQSLVKATIVSRYFWQWSNIMIDTIKKNEIRYGRKGGRIAYLDLFAGPGRYKEGSKSTPLMILEQAIKNPDRSERLLTIFNDKDEANVRSLEKELNALPGIKSLRYQPLVMNREVGTEMVKLFHNLKGTPTLFFVDPFGYKGLSLELINSVLKNFGCDCIFFFNYNRISMGLPNQAVDQHMNALFGEQRADKLRQKLETTPASEREITIVDALARALKDMGGKYVLPFRFKNTRGTRTSHHLVFVSKHFRGYELMKEIMADESSSADQGVPSFEYNPATERQPFLFELSRPLDDLENMLLSDFAGQTLTRREIYENHSVDKPYLSENYREILLKLDEEGKITTHPPAEIRPKYRGRPSLHETKVKITFPT